MRQKQHWDIGFTWNMLSIVSLSRQTPYKCHAVGFFHADNRQNNASYSYRKSNNAIWTWWSSKKTLAIVMKTPQKSYLSKGKVESLFFVDSKFNRCRWVAFLNIVLECIALESHITKFINMISSSNGNIFRVTGHLCGEFTGPRWIPRTKARDAELWCFLWSVPE